MESNKASKQAAFFKYSIMFHLFNSVPANSTVTQDLWLLCLLLRLYSYWWLLRALWGLKENGTETVRMYLVFWSRGCKPGFALFKLSSWQHHVPPHNPAVSFFGLAEALASNQYVCMGLLETSKISMAAGVKAQHPTNIPWQAWGLADKKLKTQTAKNLSLGLCLSSLS